MSFNENGIPSSLFTFPTSTGGKPCFFLSLAAFLSLFACFFASFAPALSLAPPRRPPDRPPVSGGVALSNLKSPSTSMEYLEDRSILSSRLSSSA